MGAAKKRGIAITGDPSASVYLTAVQAVTLTGAQEGSLRIDIELDWTLEGELWLIYWDEIFIDLNRSNLGYISTRWDGTNGFGTAALTNWTPPAGNKRLQLRFDMVKLDPSPSEFRFYTRDMDTYDLDVLDDSEGWVLQQTRTSAGVFTSSGFAGASYMIGYAINGKWNEGKLYEYYFDTDANVTPLHFDDTDGAWDYEDLGGSGEFVSDGRFNIPNPAQEETYYVSFRDDAIHFLDVTSGVQSAAGNATIDPGTEMGARRIMETDWWGGLKAYLIAETSGVDAEPTLTGAGATEWTKIISVASGALSTDIRVTVWEADVPDDGSGIAQTIINTSNHCSWRIITGQNIDSVSATDSDTGVGTTATAPAVSIPEGGVGLYIFAVGEQRDFTPAADANFSDIPLQVVEVIDFATAVSTSKHSAGDDGSFSAIYGNRVSAGSSGASATINVAPTTSWLAVSLALSKTADGDGDAAAAALMLLMQGGQQ